jgi:hypothetical protein
MLLLTIIAAAGSVSAQESRPLVKGSVSSPPPPAASAVPQNVLASLATLPEADNITYLSPRLILNEAAPRVLSEKELNDMRQGFGEMKKSLGFEPGNIDYVAFLVRVKKPNANLEFALPEFLSVVSGDFSTDALLQFAKGELKDKLREETYGGKPFFVMAIPELAKEAEKMPFLKSLAEIGVVQLAGNTLAIGSIPYLKAAVDATAGKGRISSELLNSVLRDPNALLSAAGSPWTAFAKTFALLGTEDHPRTPKCEYHLGDYYAAITMDATSFKLRGAVNADNPDTAKIIKSLLSMLLKEVTSYVKDAKAQAILNGLVITPTETEVLVQAEFSQQAVADFIKEQSAPKKQATSASAPVETKPKEVTKPVHRRRHRRTTKKTSGT